MLGIRTARSLIVLLPLFGEQMVRSHWFHLLVTTERGHKASTDWLFERLMNQLPKPVCLLFCLPEFLSSLEHFLKRESNVSWNSLTVRCRAGGTRRLQHDELVYYKHTKGQWPSGNGFYPWKVHPGGKLRGCFPPTVPSPTDYI